METFASPLTSRLDRPGDQPVEVPIICVITRFDLRSVRYFLMTYLDYRRVVREAKAAQAMQLLAVIQTGKCYGQ